jgi:methylthioribose-1-phosphate isomerase
MDRHLALLTDRFNTLWYDNGVVHLLDRRKYPFSTEFVLCRTLEEVAVAIETMIIQGAPPLAYAAGLSLAIEARAHSGDSPQDLQAALEAGANRLRRTRPTGWDLFYVLDECLRISAEARRASRDVAQSIVDHVYGLIEAGNRTARTTGRNAADLLPDGANIQTICFAGAALNYMLYFAAEDGKDVHLYACETRPFLQGARMTAQSAREMGIPVTVVTDGMPGYLMWRKMTNVFVATADKITWDGHIANKIGTYPIALAAFDNDIPFYVLGYNGPAPDAKTVSDIHIEERNPEEVLFCRGVRTAAPGVDAYYPAFDITPPRLISAIVTDRGVFPPRQIHRYFSTSPAMEQSAACPAGHASTVVGPMEGGAPE